MVLQSYFILCHHSSKKDTASYSATKEYKAIAQHNIKALFNLYWMKNIYVISEEPEEIINDFPITFPNNQLYVTQPGASKIKSICDIILRRCPQASITICYLDQMMPDFLHLSSALENARHISQHYPILLTVGVDNKEVDLPHGYLRYNKATNHEAKEVSDYYPDSSLNCLTVKYDNDVICHSGIFSANGITLMRNFNEIERQDPELLDHSSINGVLEHCNNTYVLPSYCQWYTMSQSNPKEAKTIQMKAA